MSNTTEHVHRTGTWEESKLYVHFTKITYTLDLFKTKGMERGRSDSREIAKALYSRKGAATKGHPPRVRDVRRTDGHIHRHRTQMSGGRGRETAAKGYAVSFRGHECPGIAQQDGRSGPRMY